MKNPGEDEEDDDGSASGSATAKGSMGAVASKPELVFRFLGAGFIAACLLSSIYFLTAGRGNAASSALVPSGATAEHFGWRQAVPLSDVSLNGISVAAGAPGSRRLSLLAPNSSQMWTPGQRAQAAVRTGFSVADRAECGAGVWLIHDDYLHVTKWDAEKQRALETIAMPEPFQGATCLDRAGDRWLLVIRDDRGSRLLEFDAAQGRTLQTLASPEYFFTASSDPQQHHLALLSGHGISVRTCTDLEEVFHTAFSETMFRDVAFGWSPSGRYFAFGVKQLAVYDMERQNRVQLLASEGWIKGVGWVSDTGLSAMDDRGRLYWTSDLRSGWQLRQEPASESVYSVFWIQPLLAWLAQDDNQRAMLWQYFTPPIRGAF